MKRHGLLICLMFLGMMLLFPDIVIESGEQDSHTTIEEILPTGDSDIADYPNEQEIEPIEEAFSIIVVKDSVPALAIEEGYLSVEAEEKLPFAKVEEIKPVREDSPGLEASELEIADEALPLASNEAAEDTKPVESASSEEHESETLPNAASMAQDDTAVDTEAELMAAEEARLKAEAEAKAAEEARLKAEAEAKAAEEARLKAEAEAKAAEEARLKAEAEKAALLEKAYMVMSWQMDSGGWAKNNKVLYQRHWNGEEPKSANYSSNVGSIDNFATIPELRVLAKAYTVTGDESVRDAFYKGLDFLLEMQYETGAFPQCYPVSENSHLSYGTFNDEATTQALSLFRDVSLRYGDYRFVNDQYHQAIKNGLDLGVEFILNTQIVVNGTATGWCSQHHPYTYEPMNGRSYELKSISGFSTVKIIDLLKSLNSRDPRVTKSINDGVNWLEATVMRNRAYVKSGSGGAYFVDHPYKMIWYRFYEIGTNVGFYANRDGHKVYDIMEVDEERRHGYAWAGGWGTHLVEP